MKLYLFGASGSGTTTIARAIAREWGCPFFDNDDFFWLQTDPPFTRKRPREERQTLLRDSLSKTSSWVLAGSMMQWGEFLFPEIDLAVYLSLEAPERMKRLRLREIERYGDRIAPGGDMRKTHLDFLEWAGAYETAGSDMRSRASHLEWMKTMPFPILKIVNDRSVRDIVGSILRERDSTD